MIKIQETVIVEGKYDRIKLSSFLDACIIETNGFRIFKDKERMRLIRRVANETGIIVLTDSDAAGFQIRAKLAACIPKHQIKHVFIPDIVGKERRKAVPSKEGKLGVEGIDAKLLQDAITACAMQRENEPELTKTDFYLLGLSGGANSVKKRTELLKHLEFPERMPPNTLLRTINAIYGKKRFLDIYKTLFDPNDLSDLGETFRY